MKEEKSTYGMSAHDEEYAPVSAPLIVAHVIVLAPISVERASIHFAKFTIIRVTALSLVLGSVN